MSDAEFDDEAGARARRIDRLQGEDRIAAACRGSANPAALHWLSERLELSPDHLVADLGAGLGGPAAWIRSHRRCSVVACDPSPAAADGVRDLFGLQALQATAAFAPFADGSFDAVLLLGVLSVVDDRAAVVREARRLSGRVGVLDYCSVSAETLNVGGSSFPTVTELEADLAAVWPQVRMKRISEPAPAAWNRAADRAQEGVARPKSEREVADAIEQGRLVMHAAVGR